MTEEIRHGDVLDRLREMPTGSVQCVVTSPPYYGLRDYGTDAWEGGDPNCDHTVAKRGNPDELERIRNRGTDAHGLRYMASYHQECGMCGARRVSPWVGGDPDCDHQLDTAHQTLGATSQRAGRSNVEEQRNENFRSVCGKCGARRAGRWTGGDPGCDHSMAGSRIVGNAPSLKSTLTTNNGAGPRPGDKFHADQRREVATECPCGARWTTSQLGLEQTPDEYVARLVEIFSEIRRVLRHDGVAWLNLGDSYNNRSVARPSSHQGGLGFSNDSIERSWADQTKLGLSRLSLTGGGLKEKDLLGIPWMVAFALRADGWYLRSDVIWAKPNPMPESVTDRPTNAHEHVFLLTKSARYFYDGEAIREKGVNPANKLPGRGMTLTEHYGAGNGGNAGLLALRNRLVDEGSGAMGRNKRNVWEIATQPYAEAHFATFPTKLVEPCLLAGSSPKACGQCGAPWERVVEREAAGERQANGALHLKPSRQAEVSTSEVGGTSVFRTGVWTTGRTTGWQPTCAHQNDSGRSLVLDPFAGSGTVGVVARWHGRNFVGIELNAEYCAMARHRIMREGHPGRRAEKMAEAAPGQMAMDLD